MSADSWCHQHQEAVVDGRCVADIRAGGVAKLRELLEAGLRAEREMIERRMYSDTLRLKDIRDELGVLHIERWDG